MSFENISSTNKNIKAPASPDQEIINYIDSLEKSLIEIQTKLNNAKEAYQSTQQQGVRVYQINFAANEVNRYEEQLRLQEERIQSMREYLNMTPEERTLYDLRSSREDVEKSLTKARQNLAAVNESGREHQVIRAKNEVSKYEEQLKELNQKITDLTISGVDKLLVTRIRKKIN